jgi:hypothetical protein
MGAYGGKAKASKSYLGETVCGTVVAGMAAIITAHKRIFWLLIHLVFLVAISMPLNIRISANKILQVAYTKYDSRA